MSIVSHVCRAYSPDPIYIPEYMPEKHRKYLERSFRIGETIGRSMLIVVNHFLPMHKVEQQGYKSCVSLIKLADRYGTDRVENACARYGITICQAALTVFIDKPDLFRHRNTGFASTCHNLSSIIVLK